MTVKEIKTATAEESIQATLTGIVEGKKLGVDIIIPSDLDGRVLSFIAPPDGSLKKGDTFSFNEGHGQAEVLGVGTTVEEGCVYYDLNITYK